MLSIFEIEKHRFGSTDTSSSMTPLAANVNGVGASAIDVGMAAFGWSTTANSPTRQKARENSALTSPGRGFFVVPGSEWPFEKAPEKVVPHKGNLPLLPRAG